MDGRSRASGVLRERLERVLASADPRVQRLSASGTSITFLVTDEPDATVTVLLDRSPPRVIRGAEPAEISIEFSLEDAARFAVGQLSLPAEMMVGRFAYRGPVRKYLAVDPVLRSLLASPDVGKPGG